jgi:hypothetical protein
MKFAIQVLVFLLCCTPAVRAQGTGRARKPAKIGHYIRTHKELLISDAIILLALNADAGSSVHCQHVSPNCLEANSITGPRPSNAAIWGVANGYALGLIAGEHLVWWQAQKVDPEARHMILIFPVVMGVYEYLNVTGIITDTKLLENARARVMRRQSSR